MARKPKTKRPFVQTQQPKHLTPSIIPPSRTPLAPLNPRQGIYLKALMKEDQIVALGPAGTGKTYLPSLLAIDQLMDKEIKKIVITRPVVEVDGEKLGYLPGDQNAKFGPWTVPILDAFEERAGKIRVRCYIENGQIELAPLGMMRGRTLKEAFVLLDEAQNTSWATLKMLLTRMGIDTKLVITGDLNQTDLKGANGLGVMLDIIRNQRLPVPVIEFNTSDVVRSELCAMWVSAIEQFEGKE
jgi:phosphate starvation-inducible PhoH-like protein